MITEDKLRAMRRPVAVRDWREDDSSKAQRGYIKILTEDRQVPESWQDRIVTLLAEGLTKGKAGEIISELKKLPLKSAQDRSKDQPDFYDVPAGRYALRTNASGEDQNDTIFYHVWRHKDNPRAVKVYIKAGQNEYLQPHFKAKVILKAIYRAGIGDAALLYGKELGVCSNCGRYLTNRLSRRLHIGPVCGARLFGDSWQERVSGTRQALLDAGLSPEENLPKGPIREGE